MNLFSNVSFENLELLSVEQILADLAVFIRAARQAIPTAEFSRVILWGSGCGASFAVLARARYPHLVYGVWSSSGIIESSTYSWGKTFFKRQRSIYSTKGRAFVRLIVHNINASIARQHCYH